ncbi:aldehyde dehydrogenase family protein [Dictyocaulus viviparus]|uniref:Aldehyde dehydrogenase n=1 Tax=Dictyocaulus viviparus TaxID=29172 RepID=A0A0D8XQF2_DICVI|nr:aldehyde dehydrogenase family protein [Dictyocaulus viviparus]
MLSHFLLLFSRQIVSRQRQYFRNREPVKIEHRRKQLHNLRRLITENTDMLCDAVYMDMRRHPQTTYIMEIANAIVEIDYMLDNLKNWSKPILVQKTLSSALDQPMIIKEPLGVVLIISPWNYPVTMILLPLIPAIAAGNTVIIKPSEVSSHTAATFEKLIPKYFAPEFLTVINGGVSETTELLKERFDHILYTGCPPVAKIIMTAAAKHLTPVTLELGGKWHVFFWHSILPFYLHQFFTHEIILFFVFGFTKNWLYKYSFHLFTSPVLVEDDADIDITARRIAWGKWLNCGQTCLAPDYVLVSERTKLKLVEALGRYIREFYGVDIQSSKDYSRIINQRHHDRISSLLKSSQGTILFQGGEEDRDDLFIPPVIFGPILPVLTIKDMNEALDYINSGEKPLAAYIFTRSESKARRFCDETSSGGVTINDVLMHITVDTLPFGGVGTSGMGRYRGKFGFDTFTHEKAVLKRGFFGESLASARYPPVSQEKLKQLARLTGTRRALPSGLSWLSGIPRYLRRVR